MGDRGAEVGVLPAIWIRWCHRTLEWVASQRCAAFSIRVSSRRPMKLGRRWGGEGQIRPDQATATAEPVELVETTLQSWVSCQLPRTGVSVTNVVLVRQTTA